MVRNFRRRFTILCTVLLLWQTGIAPLVHASAAHVAVEGVSAATVESADSEILPCHGHESDTELVPSTQPDHHAGPAASPDSPMKQSYGVNGMDCCKSLDCQCACIHASLNSAPIAVPALIVPDHPAVLGGDLPALRARTVELFKPPI